MSAHRFELQDRVALVTGAGSGIGRATALALADAGAKLIICDIQEASLAEVAAILEQRGQLVLSSRVDVADRAAMHAFAAAVHTKVAAIDVLINNAGVGLAGGILNMSLEDWDWVLGINLGGVIHGCHLFIPKMVERNQGGHVVNVSSLLGYVGDPGMIGYCTSKFAVYGLSESLRNDLHKHDIGVSVICPGVIDTNIVKTTRYRFAPSRDVSKLRERAESLYKKRNYPPAKVAAAIVAAIRHNRAVVPVSPEAWAMYALSRVSWRLTGRLFGSARMLDRMNKPK